MAKDWSKISDEELLNFDGPQTATIAQYERIMQKRTVDALMDVRGGLHDVKTATNLLADKLDKRLAEVDRAQREASSSQTSLQRAALALTVVIAISTVVYTWVTWQSVQAQREANEINRLALPAAKK